MKVYHQAFNKLYVFENELRLAVYIILKADKGRDWINSNITTDDDNQVSIGKSFRIRKKMNDKYNYLGESSSNPMVYLTSGELIQLFNSEKSWKNFKHIFSMHRNTVESKLGEVIAIRNNLAHFRPLSKRDVIVLENNIDSLKNNLIPFINGIFDNDYHFASNTEVDFYRKLKEFDSSVFKFKFSRSENIEFGKIKLIFDVKSIWTGNIDFGEFNAVVGVINFNSLFNKYPDILEFMIYSSLSYRSKHLWEKIGAYSELDFIFSFTYLDKHIGKFLILLEEIEKEIAKELELVKNDRKYRGELLHILNVSLNSESYLDENMHEERGLQAVLPIKRCQKFINDIPNKYCEIVRDLNYDQKRLNGNLSFYL